MATCIECRVGFDFALRHQPIDSCPARNRLRCRFGRACDQVGALPYLPRSSRRTASARKPECRVLRSTSTCRRWGWSSADACPASSCRWGCSDRRGRGSGCGCACVLRTLLGVDTHTISSIHNASCLCEPWLGFHNHTGIGIAGDRDKIQRQQGQPVGQSDRRCSRAVGGLQVSLRVGRHVAASACSAVRTTHGIREVDRIRRWNIPA
jgi:hypothetical protein